MKSTGLRIAIMPIGSIVKFKKEHLKRSDGSVEYYKTIWALTHNANIDQLVILQKSDWDKLTDEEKADIDPRGVIYDVYSEHGLKTGNPKDRDDLAEWAKYTNVYEAVKDMPVPDFAITFLAQGFASVNIPLFLPKKKDPSGKNMVLSMTLRYSAPMIHYLNVTKIPYFVIATDPRYCPAKLKRRDVANRPLEFISQFNETCLFTSISEYKSDAEETMSEIPISYTGIEKINLVNEKVISPDTERPIKFAISAMQSAYGETTTKDYRFDELKKWVLNQPGSEDYHIYGKWIPFFTKDHSQFKGMIAHTEIDDTFSKTRYTLVIPIRPNWVTGKYVEMLRVGCVPFFHPQYDTQYSTVAKDHFLRVKDPRDMYKKIEYLEANPDKRLALVKELQIKFLLGVRKGDFFAKLVNESLIKHNLPVRLEANYSDELKRIIKRTVKLF